jgi:hypothetical protein
LKDGNWPVFAVLAPFVASLGRVIVSYVKQVLSTNDDVWKYWVLSGVVRSASPEVVDDIRSELERISARPTEGEAEEEVDKAAAELLGARRGDVWVFVAEGGRFPSAVFSSVETAEPWIARYRVSGTLTQYPLDVGTFDWAIEKGVFKPKRDEHTTPRFVGRFTSASQEHHHYVDGKSESMESSCAWTELLRAADDRNHFEWPGGWTAEKERTAVHRVRQVVADLEARGATIRELSVPPRIQDASFVAEIDGDLEGGPFALRFSCFGNFVGAKDGAAAVVDVLARNRFVLIPEEALAAPYAPPSALWPSVRTWWDRYFEYG